MAGEVSVAGTGEAGGRGWLVGTDTVFASCGDAAVTDEAEKRPWIGAEGGRTDAGEGAAGGIMAEAQ